MSDNLSCTSGYSIFTNEGSTISGMVNNLQDINRNINPRNILNSNQMINNYNQTNSTPNTNVTSNNMGYNLNSSNNELPFIHRLLNTNTHTNINTNTQQITNQQNMDIYPKINLQIPSMLSPGEVAMMGGYSPYPESNIDIYVHTLVAPSNLQSAPNTRNPNTVSNSTSVLNNETSSINTDLINNLINTRNYNLGDIRPTTNTGTNTTTNIRPNVDTTSQENINNFWENFGNVVSRPRNGSVTSETSNSSFINQHLLQNNLSNLNRNIKETSTQTEQPINLLLHKDKE